MDLFSDAVLRDPYPVSAHSCCSENLRACRSTLPSHDSACLFPDMKSVCIPVVPAVVACGALYAALFAASPAGPAETRTLVSELVTSGYPSLFNIYSNLHAHPELSFMEVKTSALV